MRAGQISMSPSPWRTKAAHYHTLPLRPSHPSHPSPWHTKAAHPLYLPQVRVRRTKTVPEFDFAYTDPSLDYDVSYHMQNSGGVEMGITKVTGGGEGEGWGMRWSACEEREGCTAELIYVQGG